MAEHLFSVDFSEDFDRAPLFTTGARPHFGFPFWLGAVPDIVVVPAPAPARWTTLTNETNPWIAQGSDRHRFERIYAQPRNTFGSSINFSFKISSQFPHKVQSANPVTITSTITSP